MALTLTVPEQNPITGVRGTMVRPLTEGERQTAVPQQKSRGGIWGALDDLTTTVINGASDVAGAIAQKEVDGLVTGPESQVDTTGNPADQVGSVTPAAAESSFLDRYRQELMIGGGAIGVLLLVFMMRGK